MNEPNSDLRQTLMALHAQLASAPDMADDNRDLLKRVLADIERALGEPATENTGDGETAADDSSLSERLTESARGFETSHPNLSAAIESLINTLAQMGI